MIGDEVEVVITRIEGQKVRIGITAPPEVEIRRPEQLARDRVAAARQADPQTSAGTGEQRPGAKHVSKVRQQVVIDSELATKAGEEAA